MLKTLRSNQGFSLVELMIVVAIIGILASVAIPNFQRFQRKARQSEAKNMMSAYYTSEKAFVAEFNQYAGNFYATGYKPDGKLGYRLTTVIGATAPWPAMGITQPTAIQISCVNTNQANCPGPTGAAPGDWTEPQAQVNNIGPDTAYSGAIAPVGQTSFTASAGGYIGTTLADHWTIDNTMTMTNTQSGL